MNLAIGAFMTAKIDSLLQKHLHYVENTNFELIEELLDIIHAPFSFDEFYADRNLTRFVDVTDLPYIESEDLDRDIHEPDNVFERHSTLHILSQIAQANKNFTDDINGRKYGCFLVEFFFKNGPRLINPTDPLSQEDIELLDDCVNNAIFANPFILDKTYFRSFITPNSLELIKALCSSDEYFVFHIPLTFLQLGSKKVSRNSRKFYDLVLKTAKELSFD